MKVISTTKLSGKGKLAWLLRMQKTLTPDRLDVARDDGEASLLEARQNLTARIGLSIDRRRRHEDQHGGQKL